MSKVENETSHINNGSKEWIKNQKCLLYTLLVVKKISDLHFDWDVLTIIWKGLDFTYLIRLFLKSNEKMSANYNASSMDKFLNILLKDDVWFL